MTMSIIPNNDNLIPIDLKDYSPGQHPNSANDALAQDRLDFEALMNQAEQDAQDFEASRNQGKTVLNQPGGTQTASIEEGLQLRTGIVNGHEIKPEADLENADLAGADFSNYDMTDARLKNANLEKANLSGSKLQGAYFSGANLKGADLSGIDASPEMEVWSTGYVSTNETRFSGADLTGAKAVDGNFRNASFSFANLSNVDFTGADLRDADFGAADTFKGANFTNADLRGADLSVAPGEEEGIVVNGALFDATTRLPPNMTRQEAIAQGMVFDQNGKIAPNEVASFRTVLGDFWGREISDGYVKITGADGETRQVDSDGTHNLLNDNGLKVDATTVTRPSEFEDGSLRSFGGATLSETQITVGGDTIVHENGKLTVNGKNFNDLVPPSSPGYPSISQIDTLERDGYKITRIQDNIGLTGTIYNIEAAEYDVQLSTGSGSYGLSSSGPSVTISSKENGVGDDGILPSGLVGQTFDADTDLAF